MNRRICKLVREDAIHCLEQCASDWISGIPTSTGRVCEPGDAHGLAVDAWLAVAGLCGSSPAIDYLEAAALLRDGWSPGEPVVML